MPWVADHQYTFACFLTPYDWTESLVNAYRERCRELQGQGYRPAALSGGERQRVAIARALANRPRLLLADEPTGNLDPASAATILDVLAGLPAETGCTLVVVTHNPEVAARADRRLVLAAGRLVATDR